MPRDTAFDDDTGRPRDRDDDRDDRDDDRPRRRSRPPQSNGIAVVGLVVGIVGMCCPPLLSIPALVLSGIGLSRASSRGGAGRGPAIAGLVIGALGLLATPITIGLLLPAVQKVREAAARKVATQNLTGIGRQFQDYERATGAFPRPFAGTDAQRNLVDVPTDPLQRGSWRVEVLRHSGATWAAGFDASQRWDAPKNRPVAETPVAMFTDPTRQAALLTETPYRVFTGNGALFDLDPAKPPVRLIDITDGASNTIFCVQAEAVVPWAQCNELPYTPGRLPPLGPKHAAVFLAAMADGSVRPVRKNVDPRVIENSITHSGGEPVSLPTD